MGVLSRMTTLVKVKVNKLLGAAEDPRETLDYSYERQLQMLQDVKRGVVEVATSKRRLELQKAKLQENVDRLTDQAKQAVAVGRDDLARQALERKGLLQGQMSDLDTQTQTLDQEQAKLEQAETRLRMKIEAFRTRKEVVKAQYSAAEAQVRIGEAVTGLSEEMTDVGMALDRATEKTEALQARAGAIDEMIAQGSLEDFTSSGKDSIDRELSQIQIKESVDSELAALKAQVGAPAQPKSLAEGQQQ
ncbi:MAG TPA: PspA/IM30 family protein [Thermomicrobiaceae bacterium]|nr:PspA/IM30 family protein [Thermomicrobiaceae bacterium]